MCVDVKAYPPDYSCSPDNPDAQYDETIIETCDYIDNNCDGITDEGCECMTSESRQCWDDDYPINLYTHGGFGELYGECDYGIQICRQLPEGGSEWGFWLDGPDRTGGTEDDIWSPGLCEGTVLPQTEVCDCKDNNCDNKIDESLKRTCWNGPRNADGSPQDYLVFYDVQENPNALCKMGIQTCVDCNWSGCLYEVLPTREICDTIDNDCDGTADEGAELVGTNCGLTDVGVCKYGKYSCKGGDLICNNPSAILPETEECDGRDNDCDGEVDELLVKPCESECGSGFEICSNGNWIDCTAPKSQEELCDGMDNDCDGFVDEEIECSCPAELIGSLIRCQSNPVLICGTGYMRCECDLPDCEKTHFTECQALCAYEFAIQEECIPEIGEGSPETCNNWDDDCDGEVDEDLTKACYTGPPETLDIGLCEEGALLCKQGRWGNTIEEVFVDNICLEQTLPEDEICDQLDNDCDGEIDEDLNSHDKVDMVFVIDRSGSMCNIIDSLKRAIEPYVLAFRNTPHRFAIINVPGGVDASPPPPNTVLVDFMDAVSFQAALNNVHCDMGSIEAQYDAVYDVAENNFNLSFRDDAFPMMVVFTDEMAQTQKNLSAADVRLVLSPCRVGDCGQGDRFETYVITPQAFFNQWCGVADIALNCYDLDRGDVKEYLEDIFTDVCR